MKSEGFAPDNLSEEEKARLAAEAAAEEKLRAEAAKQGINTKFPDIKKEDLVLDSENFNISVDKSGKVSRKLKEEPVLDTVEISKEAKKRLAKEKKESDKAKLEATRIALEKETEETIRKAELIKGGAEYVIDEKGNSRLELTKEQTEKIAADEEAEKQEKIAKIQAERYGIKDVSIAKNIGKGALDTALSIFGARLPFAAIDLYSFNKNKKGAKVAASELLETITLKNSQNNEGNEQSLTESQIERNKTLKEAELIKGGAKYYFDDNGERKISLTKKQIESAKNKVEIKSKEDERAKGMLEKKTVKSSINPEVNIEIGPVRDRIRSFNEKLKSVDLPAAEKQELRNQMATLLKEHRHDSDKLEAQKVEKVAKTFDVYASSSAKVMGVAKETVNTAAVCTGMPFVRLLGYSLFSGAQSFMQAGNIYDKKHFKDGEVNTKEKLAYVSKSLTIDAAKETFSTYTDLLKKDTYKDKSTLGKVWGKAVAKTFSLGFTALRVAGLVKFEEQLISGGNILAGGGEKFVAALGDGHLGEALKQGGENWVNNAKYMLSFVGIGQDPNEVGQTTVNNSNNAKPAYTATGDNAENSSYVVNEKSAEVLAGEGPQHAIGRQVKENLENFGFKGDVNDAHEIAKFVSQKTHEIVTQNGLDDIGIKEAGAHIVLNQNGIVSGLTPENTYQIPSTNEAITNVLIKQAVMDDNVESLISNTDSLSGSGDKIVQEFDKVMQLDNHIKNDIFHIQSSGKEGLAEWDKVQEVSANDILDRKYGDLTKSEYYDPSGSHTASTKLHYDRLADDLKSLNEKTPINENESVLEYYKRAIGIRSTDLTDYIENPTIAENLRTQSVVNKIKDIFHHWYDRDSAGDKQWEVIKKLSVKDVLDGKFGDFIHGKDNIAERSGRGGIQELLQLTLKKTPMLDKETVEAFIVRANKILSIKI